jgi:hypothetical protein
MVLVWCKRTSLPSAQVTHTGQADALVLCEARETAPLLEAEANGILNTTANLEGDPG